MNPSRGIALSLLGLLLLLGGCATRPINPPIKDADANTGYTFQTRQKHFKSQENLVVLAFSGGIRAAALPYGVLEMLAAPKDKAEFDYLNRQPTSFVLPVEVVDRLRAAAGTIILLPPSFSVS
jgi:hypothetical protein